MQSKGIFAGNRPTHRFAVDGHDHTLAHLRQLTDKFADPSFQVIAIHSRLQNAPVGRVMGQALALHLQGFDQEVRALLSPICNPVSLILTPQFGQDQDHHDRCYTIANAASFAAIFQFRQIAVQAADTENQLRRLQRGYACSLVCDRLHLDLPRFGFGGCTPNLPEKVIFFNPFSTLRKPWISSHKYLTPNLEECTMQNTMLKCEIAQQPLSDFSAHL